MGDELMTYVVYDLVGDFWVVCISSVSRSVKWQCHKIVGQYFYGLKGST